jgi:hypothetical protein
MSFYYPATKKDLIELLTDVREYMSNKVDIEDTESDVDSQQRVRTSEESRLMASIEYVLGSYVEKLPEPVYGDQSKYEMPGYQETMDNLNNLSIRKDDDTMMNESIQKIKLQFKRFL